MGPKSPRPERSRPTTLRACVSHWTPVQLHGDDGLSWFQVERGLLLPKVSRFRLDLKEIKASLSIAMLEVASSKFVRRAMSNNIGNWRNRRVLE